MKTVIVTIDPEDGNEFSVIIIPIELDLSTIVHQQWYTYAVHLIDDDLEKALDFVQALYLIDLKMERNSRGLHERNVDRS